MRDILWLPDNIFAAAVNFDPVRHRAELAVLGIKDVQTIYGEFVLIDVICEWADGNGPKPSGIPGHFMLLPVVPCADGCYSLCSGCVQSEGYTAILEGIGAGVIGWILRHCKASFMRCCMDHADQIRQGLEGIHPASRCPSGCHSRYKQSIRVRCQPWRALANLLDRS